jgi:DNA (cytosine-5)-methyltransferase 1
VIRMKVAALFAGIGGLEEGLRRAGHQTMLTCEIWGPAIAVLRHHFAETPNHPDVAELRSLPAKVELLTAGFPCQDLSQAGQTRGIAGSKSGLVGDVFRLLDKRRVPVVVLENVSFMLQLDRGAAMRTLTAAFEERGYRWAYRTIDSQSFLPQRRERVFFVASAGDLDPADVLFIDDVSPKLSTTPLQTHAHGFYWTEGTRGLGWADDAVPTLKNGSTIGIPSPPAVLMPDGEVIKPDIRDAERLQGFPTDWTQPAEESFRGSLRWSLVGNAVTVAVSEWLGTRLARPGQYRGELDTAWKRDEGSWPRAARSVKGGKVEVVIGKYPCWSKRTSLHKFLKFEGSPLSSRATAGFLSRAQASSLRFRDGFLDLLRDHLMRMQRQEEKIGRVRQIGARAAA